MFKSKYSTILTVILIILIIAIIVIATFISISMYKSYEEEKDKNKAIADLQDNKNETKNDVENKDDGSNEDDFKLNTIIQGIENGESNNTTNQGNNTSRPKPKFYKNYPMIGTIKISKINLEYPILLDISPGALDVSVGVMYPTNPNLNEPGNTVIIGHNYRNGKFFANNKKLVIGDKIQITDLNKRTLTYTIYEISETTEQDTEYVTRERGSNIEISLSTCTDDGKGRLVILAKVEN